MERLDAGILEVGDVHAVDGRWAVWRPSLPAQSAEAMMAEGRSGRGEGEVRRQAGEQPGHRFGDRSVTLRCRVGRFMEHGVLGIEFVNRPDAFPPSRSLNTLARLARIRRS